MFFASNCIVSALKTIRFLHFLQFASTVMLDLPSQEETLLPHLGQYIVTSSVILNPLFCNKKAHAFCKCLFDRSVFERITYRVYQPCISATLTIALFFRTYRTTYFFINLSNAILTLSSVFPPPILSATTFHDIPFTTRKLTILLI